MKQAMKAVETGSLINQTALDHDVPPTILKDRLSGRVECDVPGPKQYLNSEEDTQLATFLKTCLLWGMEKQGKMSWKLLSFWQFLVSEGT